MTDTLGKLLVTRRMPPNVEARAARRFTVSGNPDDVVRPIEAVIEAAQGHRGILCCASERFTAEAISSTRGLGCFGERR